MRNYISGLKIGQSHQFLADRININTDFSKSNLQDLCDLVGDDLRDLMDFLLYKRGYNVSFVAESEENENNLLEFD